MTSNEANWGGVDREKDKSRDLYNALAVFNCNHLTRKLEVILTVYVMRAQFIRDSHLQTTG